MQRQLVRTTCQCLPACVHGFEQDHWCCYEQACMPQIMHAAWDTQCMVSIEKLLAGQGRDVCVERYSRHVPP